MTAAVKIGSADATSQADPTPPRVRRRHIEGDTAAEHRASGRAGRTEVPLSAHGDWAVPADRPDPVALLIEQGETRVADLVPIRYGQLATR